LEKLRFRGKNNEMEINETTKNKSYTNILLDINVNYGLSFAISL